MARKNIYIASNNRHITCIIIIFLNFFFIIHSWFIDTINHEFFIHGLLSIKGCLYQHYRIFLKTSLQADFPGEFWIKNTCKWDFIQPAVANFSNSNICYCSGNSQQVVIVPPSPRPAEHNFTEWKGMQKCV